MKIKLTFKQEELLYDIKNTAYTMADVMTEADNHEKHQLADIGEDGNIDRVTRILDLEVSRCRENLYAFTKTKVSGDEQYDDVLRETDEYIIQLEVSENFSQTSALYLENLIHNFLVYRVLSEWIGLIDADNNDERKDRFALKANNLMDEINRSLFLKVVKTRRTISPF